MKNSSSILLLVSAVSVFASCSSTGDDGASTPNDSGAPSDVYTPPTSDGFVTPDVRADAPSETSSIGSTGCEAWGRNFETQCPEFGDQSGTVIDCESLAQHAGDLGCTNEFSAFVTCESTGQVDCKVEDVTTCKSLSTAVAACQANAVSQNPCERIRGADPRCAAVPGKPNAWGCTAPTTRMDSAPAPADSGLPALYFCCP